MSILPITWADKIDDPSILAVLQETDPKTYISATEINQIKKALNELFNTPFSMTQDLINEITRATGAEGDLNAKIIIEQQQRINKDNSIESSVITEKNRASNAETALTVALENEKALRISTNSANATAAALEYSRNINAEQVLRTDLVLEIVRATNADTNHVALITAERNRATNVESAISLNLESEITRAHVREDNLNDVIVGEIARATIIDATLIADMRNETDNRKAAVLLEKTRAETAELSVRNALIQETASRLAAFTLLSDRVSFIVANIDPANIDSLSELLNAYKNADSNLADAMTLLGTNLSNVIDVESKSRIAGQVVLTADIATEKTRATAAELKLSQDLVNETTRANAADLLLETEIDNEVVRAKGVEVLKSPIDNPVFTGNGIQYPKLTTAQRDLVLSPDKSLTIYNTTNNLIEVYNGTEWVSLSGHDSVSSVVPSENLELVPALVSGMKLTPPAGTYLANFNAQFDSILANITNQANANLQELILNLTSRNVTNSTFPSLLNGAVVVPGVYYSAAAASIVGNVKLDAGGNPNAIFVFVIGAAFDTAAGSSLLLVNGATANNVFFVVNAAINIMANSSLSGTFISTIAAVGLGAGTKITGRVYSSNSAININASVITKPTQASPIPLGFLETFVLFTGSGTITNVAVSSITGDAGTNNGSAIGFEFVTLFGNVYLPGKSSSVLEFSYYVNNNKVASSSRERFNVALKETIILNERVVVLAGESIEVRVYNIFGSARFYNRNLSLIKVK